MIDTIPTSRPPSTVQAITLSGRPDGPQARMAGDIAFLAVFVFLAWGRFTVPSVG